MKVMKVKAETRMRELNNVDSGDHVTVWAGQFYHGQIKHPLPLIPSLQGRGENLLQAGGPGKGTVLLPERDSGDGAKLSRSFHPPPWRGRTEVGGGFERLLLSL